MAKWLPARMAEKEDLMRTQHIGWLAAGLGTAVGLALAGHELRRASRGTDLAGKVVLITGD